MEKGPVRLMDRLSMTPTLRKRREEYLESGLTHYIFRCQAHLRRR